ncbi:hypothetical protein B0H14DRAFT_2568607 [Mycena olivaceomarginata]|nr:hypothetical protein B0H14DRAFT_2568607 [Mycena olivaceomarginata]
MLDLLLYDIRKKTPTLGIRMMKTVVTTEILKQYNKNPRDYDPSGDRFLQRFGASLQDGSEFAGVFHINDNHWVAAAVDVIGKSVEFGDPEGSSFRSFPFSCEAQKKAIGPLVEKKLKYLTLIPTHNCEYLEGGEDGDDHGYLEYCEAIQEEGGAFYQIGSELFVMNSWDPQTKTSKVKFINFACAFLV